MVYLEGEDLAAVNNILHTLVVLLNLGGLKRDWKFGSTIWGYDLHTHTFPYAYPSRLMAAHVIFKGEQPRSLQTWYSFGASKDKVLLDMAAAQSRAGHAH